MGVDISYGITLILFIVFLVLLFTTDWITNNLFLRFVLLLVSIFAAGIVITVIREVYDYEPL